jgi:hypothetical protein
MLPQITDVRASAKNNYTALLVFWFARCVTSADTYLDMRRRTRLAAEPKSGAIRCNQLMPRP